MAKPSRCFTKNRNFLFAGAGILMAGNLLFWVFVAIFLLRIWSAEPMGESLTLATLAPITGIESSEEDLPMTELEQPQESDDQVEIPEQTKSEWDARELNFSCCSD